MMCKYAEADPFYRFDAMKIEAELLLQTGETEAARKIADALARQRGRANDWVLLADALQAERKTISAAEALLHAADSDPTAAIRASQLYAFVGNYARATEVIRRCLSVVPPLADLSKVSLELPQVPRGDIEPWEWHGGPTPLGVERSAFVGIAWIALAHRNHAAARAALLESIEETGEYWEAYEFLGDVSVDAGDKKSALEYYEKTLSLSPSEAERNRIEEKIVSIR
jgi:tetratricopeptide (TPR) repeat protein